MGSCTSKEPTPSPSSKPVTSPSTAAKRLEQNAALAKASTTAASDKKPSTAAKATTANAANENLATNSAATVTNQSDTTTTSAVPSADGASTIPSSTTETQEQSKGNSQVTKSNNAIAESASSNGSTAPEKEIKVLLLGSGESGKSTIVKQMKILHQNGYTKEELIEYKPFIYRNVVESIKNVINAIIDLEPHLIETKSSEKQELVQKGEAEAETVDENGIAKEDKKQPVEDEKTDKQETNVQQIAKSENGDDLKLTKPVLKYDELNDILDYEFTMNIDEEFDPVVVQKISHVYNTPEVLDFIKYQQGNFYLIDSTHYFLKDIDRISKKNYIPNVDDVLRTRKKTSGIFDFRFQMLSGLNIHMYDVGGQRSERKKWIHCFDNVTLIIFCVALSEYDQVLLEENTQNRLVESLNLFDSVVNSRWFSRTSIVLFLNKIDVFAEKLNYSPLENHFPDYSGGNNINKAAKYILWRFTQVNRSGLNIYPHVTQATDTSNIELVFAAVKETILENSLRDSGLL